MPLEIPEPCHEDWNTMTPSEKGKFCASCQKEVHDFSKLALSDIHTFFEALEAPAASVCGRFKATQLEAFNARYQPIPTPSLIRKWAAAAIFTAVVASPSFAQGGMHYFPFASPPPFSEQYSPRPKDSTVQTVVVAGKVVFPEAEGALPLLGAQISVLGTNIGTITDEQGYFELYVPHSEKAILLSVLYKNYLTTDYELIPNRVLPKLVITLKEHTVVLLSQPDAPYTYSRPANNKDKRRLKRALKKQERLKKRREKKKDQ